MLPGQFVRLNCAHSSETNPIAELAVGLCHMVLKADMLACPIDYAGYAAQILFRNVQDKLLWEGALVSADSNNTWTTSEFTVTEFGVPVHVSFDHVETGHWLAVEFSKQEYSGQFTL